MLTYRSWLLFWVNSMCDFSRYIFVAVFLCAILQQNACAENGVIEELTLSIARAQSDEEKSKLHIYRARNYKNIGNTEKAEEDYVAALEFDHKGWIHLERGRFYLGIGDYSQAKKDALAAQKETPTLKSQSDKIIAIAEKHDKKIVEDEPYQEILLTQRWEVNKRQQPRQVSQHNIRKSYAARNKAKARSKPRRVARS